MSTLSHTDTAAALRYGITPMDPGARLFEVLLRVRDPDPSGQIFSLPAWIPGSYLVRDFARHVVSLEAQCGGEPIPLKKVNKATWRASPASGELLVRAQIYANDGSVRGAYFDSRHAFFNGCCVFLRVHGRDQERCVVSIAPGDHPASAHWQVATGLRRLAGTEFDFGEFEADNYDDLIDHPVLMGDLSLTGFRAADVQHTVAVAGRHDADLQRLSQDLQAVCGWQADFFGRPLPMDRYLFLVRLTGDGFGGLEHRASAALVCHRNDLPRDGNPIANRGYRQLLGLASHEYFHLWHIKRIRPVEFAPYDLERETYTRQLWIFEGITSYYDDLTLLRSGRISTTQYLEELGRSLTSLYRTGGRRRQTLEESSFDVWIKFYRPDENSPNVQVSYYTKGAMVALALDLEIRLRTQGRMSLDSVMRVLWRNHADTARPVAEGAFEGLVQDVTGLDLAEFFSHSVRGTLDPPVGILLSQFGVRLNLRAAESGSDEGGLPGQREERPRPWIGIRTRVAQGRIRIAQVIDGGPAQAAGLAAEDEIIALGDLRVDSENFETLLDHCEIGQQLRLHLFRRDELLEFSLRPAAPPRDTAYLTLDEQAVGDVLARRQGWLGATSGG